MLSGIFRATTKQAIYSSLALGVGFALGAVIDLF
jgi:galactitol-specific phosphotransferase system IIC component